MPKGLSYADAVKILGGSAPWVKTVDNMVGGLLSVVTAGGSDAALSLFDAKTEMVRLGGQVSGRINEIVRGATRHDRTERLLAAHGVIVVAAVFRAVDDCFEAAGMEPAAFTGDEQLRLLGSPAGRDVVSRLLGTPIPLPSPARSYAQLLADLRDWCEPVAESLAGHVRGLAVWDDVDETVRGRLSIAGALPERAVDRFDESHRRLAEEIPEFAIWSGRLEARATATSLRRLEDLLGRAATGRDPGRHRAALARAYRARLDRPVLDGDAGDLMLPDLGDAYVDPRFRVEVAGPAARPFDETWWDGPVRDDFHDFLAVHLTTTEATVTPLLLLGQPGSGKSSLTHILAARLPASDYLVARVPLREVPADAEIQDQIEAAVRATIGRTVAWAELADDADRPLAVVLLDGFDELLQATGLHRSDYLLRVAEFQRRERDQGRPVAVIVTSRIAVVDRARIPTGSPVVRLEPFSTGQIERWLAVWNRANPPLPVDALRPFTELAEQPLLLLMLALHHAGGHPLTGDLDKAELYERLLHQFAEREVRRVHAGGPERDIPDLVEAELRRLSVVAFAMFHRNSLWVTERDLDSDLAAFELPPSRAAEAGRFTAAQEMIGRFFFIQRARAMRDDKTLHTYEFLHATFGEYLVARLLVRAVRDAMAGEQVPDRLPDLLGYTPLTTRTTVLQFARSLIDGPEIRDFLVERTRQSVTRPSYPPGAYRPIDKRIDHVMATYSFNLTMLTLICGGELRASDLFRHAADPADWLRGSALQWRAALPGGIWMEAMAQLAVRRDVHEGRRDMVLAYGAAAPPPLDPGWSNRLRSRPPGGFLRGSLGWDPVRTSMTLSNNLSDDVLLHAMEPMLRHLPDAARFFVVDDSGEVASMAHLLIMLWTAPRDRGLEAVYWRVVSALHTWEPADVRAAAAMVLRTLSGDAAHLHPGTVEAIRRHLT